MNYIEQPEVHSKYRGFSYKTTPPPPPPLNSTKSKFAHQRHGSESKCLQRIESKMGPDLVPALTGSSMMLNEYEIAKIDMFYRSHKTFVFVGHCLVCLYFTETELVDGGRSSRPCDWKPMLTGVPVLLFNKGDTKSRDKRQIQICVAERGTGFQLWADIIDNLSNYSALDHTFHTMYLSSDHRKMAGLSFGNQHASVEFLQQIESIISNPLNIALTAPKSKKSGDKFRLFRRSRSKSVGRTDIGRGVNGSERSATQNAFTDFNETGNGRNRKTPNKCDISQPCLFQHITSVNLYNYDQSPIVAASTNRSVTPTQVHYYTPEVCSVSSNGSSHNGYNNLPLKIRPTGSYGELNNSCSSASNLSY